MTTVAAVLGASATIATNTLTLDLSELREIAYNAGYLANNTDTFDTLEDVLYLIGACAVVYKEANPTPASDCNFSASKDFEFESGNLTQVTTDTIYRSSETNASFGFTLATKKALALTVPALADL